MQAQPQQTETISDTHKLYVYLTVSKKHYILRKTEAEPRRIGSSRKDPTTGERVRVTIDSKVPTLIHIFEFRHERGLKLAARAIAKEFGDTTQGNLFKVKISVNQESANAIEVAAYQSEHLIYAKPFRKLLWGKTSEILSKNAKMKRVRKTQNVYLSVVSESATKKKRKFSLSLTHTRSTSPVRVFTLPNKKMATNLIKEITIALGTARSITLNRDTVNQVVGIMANYISEIIDINIYDLMNRRFMFNKGAVELQHKTESQEIEEKRAQRMQAIEDLKKEALNGK